MRAGLRRPAVGASIASLLALQLIGGGFVQLRTADAEQGVPATIAARLRLVAAEFDPVLEEINISANLRVEYAANETGYFLTQFESNVLREWLGRLEELQVTPIAYVPDLAFLVKGLRSNMDALRNEIFVRWIGNFHPYYKMSPSLRDYNGTSTNLTLVVGLHPGEDATETSNQIQALGISIEGTDHRRIRIDTSPNLVKNVSRLHGIEWIEQTYEPRLLLNASAYLVSARRTPTEPLVRGVWFWDETIGQFNGTFGERRRIAIVDSGLDYNQSTGAGHPDFRDKVATFIDYTGEGANQDGHGHGTHVAGIAAGTGNKSNQQNLGIAPGALLVVQRKFKNDGSSVFVSFLEDLCPDAVQNGANVSSNSWGGPTGGIYITDSRDIDTCTRDADNASPGDQPLLMVFSAGNEGPTIQSVSSQAAAKNAISVGYTLNNKNSQNSSKVANESSRGPTADGRIKPDLVAPGSPILSTCTTNATVSENTCPFDVPSLQRIYYINRTGSSMAAPHVSAAALLASEFLEENRSLSPSPALIKAMLINGAIDLGYGYGTISSGPNATQCGCNIQGWGRLDVANSLTERPGHSILVWDQGSKLRTGDKKVLNIRADGTEQLKVTLAWTDPPPTNISVLKLVDDLDLIVRAPLETYVGNDFPNDSNQTNPNGRSRDRLNNVENVFLNSPGLGDYELHVLGHNVPYAQDFAMVVSGNVTVLPQTVATDDFELETFILKRGGGVAEYSTETSRSRALSLHLGNAALSAADAIGWQNFSWNGKPLTRLSLWYNWTQYNATNEGIESFTEVEIRAYSSSDTDMGAYRYVIAWNRTQPTGNVTLINVDQGGAPSQVLGWLHLDRNVTADWTGLNWSQVSKVRVGLHHKYEAGLGQDQVYFDDLRVEA